MANTTFIQRFISIDKTRARIALASLFTTLGLTATLASAFIKNVDGLYMFLVCLGFSFLAGVVSLYFTMPELEINQKFQNGKAEIIVKEGDILKEKGNIAIASNDYFETSPECEPAVTLRGAVIDHFFPDQNSSESRAKYIAVQDRYISENGLVGEPYNKDGKLLNKDGTSKTKVGNQTRYDIGTILEIPYIPGKQIFMVAMSTLDTDRKNDEAPFYSSHTDANDVLLAITALFERFFSKQSIEVTMPALGTGFSGTLNSDIFLRVTTLMAAYAMFVSDNRDKTSKLTIIIPKDRYDGKQMLALKRVMKSLVV